MKKFLCIVLIITLCIPFLTSCALVDFEPKNASALWKKINRTMNNLQSYESEVSGNILFHEDEEKIAATFSSKTIISGKRPKDFYYYSTSESRLSIAQHFQKQTITEAYHDGNMFVFSGSNRDAQRIYSPLKARDFINYLENRNLGFSDTLLQSCNNKSFTHNEDTTWSLCYSDYTEKSIDFMISSFGLDNNLFDFEIQDMKITIQADHQFRITEMTVDFIFNEEDTSNGASFNITAQYFNHDNATLITDTLNPKDYTKVEDCRLLSKFEDMFEKLNNDKDGSFVLYIEQTGTPSDKTKVTTETDTISYGEKDGNYFYNVHTVFEPFNSMTISYENGIQTTKKGSETKTKEQSETEAKIFISSLINSAQYDSSKVADIKKIRKDVYEIKCIVPSTNELGLPSSNPARKTIRITTKNGNIVKIENYIYSSYSTIISYIDFTK